MDGTMGTDAQVDMQEIGEEYIEEAQEPAQSKEVEESQEPTEQDETKADHKEEPTEKDPESPQEKKQRTKDELIEIAKEMYGVKEEDVIIDKNGKLKILMKINGKKRLLDPQKDIMKGFNLSQAGYERLNEAKEREKHVQNFFAAVKEDPNNIWKIADQMGIDKYQLAQGLLQQKVDEYSLTDEEKRIKEIERREEEIQRKETEERERLEMAKYQADKQKEMQRYGDELVLAMQEEGFGKASKLTKSHLISESVKEIGRSLAAGRDMNTKDAVRRTINKWQTFVTDFMDEIEDDHILKIIPDKVVKAIRKADLNRVKIGTPTSNARIDQQRNSAMDAYEEDSTDRKPQEKRSLGDYFNSLGY